MGQQISSGTEGQHGENGIGNNGMEFAAWRRAQHIQRQSHREKSGGDKASLPAGAKSRPVREVARDTPPGSASSAVSRPGPARNLGGTAAGGTGGSGNSSSGGSSGAGSDTAGSKVAPAETEIGRMSVRAAIDSFIENCLSAGTDPPLIQPPNFIHANNSGEDGKTNGTNSSPFTTNDKSDKSDGNTSSEVVYVVTDDGKDQTESQNDDDGVEIVKVEEKFDPKDETPVVVEDDCNDDHVAEYDGPPVNDPSRKEGTEIGDGKEEASSKADDNNEKDDEENMKTASLPPESPPHVVDVDAYCSPSPPPSQRDGGKPPAGSTSCSPINIDAMDKDRPEKKTFSEFLHDRLIAQFESSEGGSNKSADHQTAIRSSSTPATKSSPASAGRGTSSSYFQPTGPVRLQTLIDKVLDQSLNKESPPPKLNSKLTGQRKMKPSKAPVQVTGVLGKKCVPGQKSDESLRATVNTMCFKDHIEKVLEENFKFYEEDEKEQQNTLKSKDKNSDSDCIEVLDIPHVEMVKEKKKPDVGRIGPDGTISVQDIVDRVISQTEVISKMLTPPGSEQGDRMRSWSSSDSSNQNAPAGGSGSSAPKDHSQTSSKSLPDDVIPTQGAKDNKRPAPSGRKRGRPRLGSPVHRPIPKSTERNLENSPVAGENRNAAQQQRPDYTQVTPSSQSPQARGRVGHGPPPLDYVSPHTSLPHRMPMPPLVAPQGAMPIYHQGHGHPHHSQHPHHLQHPSPHSGFYNPSAPHPSSVPRTSPGSYRGYQNPLQSSSNGGPPHHPSMSTQHHPVPSQHGHVPTHHQHAPVSPQIHQRQSDHHRNPSHIPTSTAVNDLSLGKPPPLVVGVDHINGPTMLSTATSAHHNANNRLMTVSHTPTSSCSCEACVEAMSVDRSPQQQLQHHRPRATTGNSSIAAYLNAKPYDIRREDPHHTQPHHFNPYHQNNSPATIHSRRDPLNSSKESLKPVVAIGGKPLPPQAIIPSYVAAQKSPSSNSSSSLSSLYPKSDDLHGAADGITKNPAPTYNPYVHHPTEDEWSRRRSSFSEQPRANPMQPPHQPYAQNRNSALPEALNYRHTPMDPNRHSEDKPVDLHKPATPSSRYTPPASQFTPPASQFTPPASSPGDDEQPLDLSVKPLPAHKDTTRPEDLDNGSYEGMIPQNLRRPSSDSSCGEVFHSPGQAYQMKSSDNSGRPHQSTLTDYQNQWSSSDNQSSQHQQYPSQYYPHQATKLPSPHARSEGGHWPGQDSKFYQQHPSPTISSSHSQLPSSQRSQSFHSPSSQNTPTAVATASLLSLPPHLRGSNSNSSSSSSSSSSIASSSKTTMYQRRSPLADSNHQPSNPEDMCMPRLCRGSSVPPPKPPLECGPRPVLPPPSHSSPVDSGYSKHNPPPPPHYRPPPPLMQPHQQPPPPPPQQQQHSPSTVSDDPDSLKHVSRHEPIQNIIGNHPQNDILYLICKLCRQTYGSPYGFRKHFRNQHGFEPKMEHTIVQTISATKTAMSHNGPGDSPPENQFDPPKPHPEDLADERPEIGMDGYDSAEFNQTQMAAYNRAQEHVNIIFKQDCYNLENAKFLECPECGQTFQLNDFGSYKRHCRQHSMVQNSGPFSCHDCHKSFAEPGQLEQHLNTHNTFAPSVCGICRTFFSSPYYLAEHLQAAHGHVLPSETLKRASTESVPIVPNQEQNTPDMPLAGPSLDLHGRIERALLQGNEIESENLGPPSDWKLASSPPFNQKHIQSPSSSASSSSTFQTTSHSSLQPAKRHGISASTGSNSMLTVVGPNQLEVQKLVADSDAPTASPDISHDDQSSIPTSAKDTIEDAQNLATTHKDAENNYNGNNNGLNLSQKRSSPIQAAKFHNKNPNDGISKPSKLPEDNKSQNKEDNESVTSERCASVESNSNSNSTLDSPPGLNSEDSQVYVHKKYSRQLKRKTSIDRRDSTGGSESSSEKKMPRLETEGSCDATEMDTGSPLAVVPRSSSVVTPSINTNSRDCQSSSSSPSGGLQRSRSNSKSKKNPHSGTPNSPNGDGSESKNNKNVTEQQDLKSVKSNNAKSEKGADSTKNKSKDTKSAKNIPASSNTGAGEANVSKLGWDRLTRRQANKNMLPVSYTSSS